MAKKKRDKKKERSIRSSLVERYGHLVDAPTSDIPIKHRATKGGLRCFRKVYQRKNKNIQKGLPKVRCGNSCAKGSLYCMKHGGGNTNSLVHGKRSEILFKRSYNTELGNIFHSFLNDPNILDHKRELATLRTLLVTYIDKFKDNKPLNNPRKIVKIFERTLESEHLTETEKFLEIKAIVENEETILDKDVIGTISKLVDNIGKSVDRIDRIERKSDFMLTPEGFKIVLNNFSKLLNETVKDPKVLQTIYNGLLEVHTSTVGDVEHKMENAIEKKDG